MKFTISLILLLSVLRRSTRAAPDEDSIHSLPGHGPPPAPQWSGFLSPPDAPAVHGGNSHLHYWLASYTGTGHDSWTDAPVILWLNGGPGSTSLLGFFEENGPLLVGHDGDLMENPYSWTNVGNLVAIESPGGVGYSYCDTVKNDPAKSCSYDDITTAKANAAAIRELFKKFPELDGNPFYATGESYAGVYVPTLVKELLDGNDKESKPKVNVQGLLVGDPCTDNESQADSMDMLWYGHKHGFVPDEDFDLLWNQCETRISSALAEGAMQEEEAILLARDVGPMHGIESKASASQPVRILWAGDTERVMDEMLKKKCIAAQRKFLLTTSRAFSQTWRKAFVNNVLLYSPSALVRFDIPGTLDYKLARWMMKPEVKTAIHVSDSPARKWLGPTHGWDYKNSYAACSDLRRSETTPSMIDVYHDIAPRLEGKVMVINGDTDPCVSYEGTRAAIKAVGFDEVNAFRPWFFNATATSSKVLDEKDVLFGPSLSAMPTGPQLGGHVVDYEHDLSFATVHGSGHMFPQFRPRASLTLLKHVVRGETLSPPIPDDDKIASMSGMEFDKFLDDWVDKAQGETFLDS